MSVELKISMTPKDGPPRLIRFANAKPAAIKRGVKAAAEIFRDQIVENLSGPSHSRYPGNSNPFPGVFSGELRRSTQRPMYVDGGMGAIVGPLTNDVKKYAAVQEFGSKRAGRGRKTVIPPRPYVSTAARKVYKKAVTALVEQIRRALR